MKKVVFVAIAIMLFSLGCTRTRDNLQKEKVFYYNGSACTPFEQVAFTPDESLMAFFTVHREFTVHLKKGNRSEMVKYTEPLDYALIIPWTPNTTRIFFRLNVWNKNFVDYKIVRKVFQGDSLNPQSEKVILDTFVDVVEKKEVDFPVPKVKGQPIKIEMEVIPKQKKAFQKPLKAYAVYVFPPEK